MTAEFDPAPWEWAPTGTYSDALEARTLMAEAWPELYPLALRYGDIMASATKTKAEREGLDGWWTPPGDMIARMWRNALLPNTPTVYVAADQALAVAQSADTVPAPASLNVVEWPDSGLGVLAQPIPIYIDSDTRVGMVAFSWARFGVRHPDIGESFVYLVTPWVASGGVQRDHPVVFPDWPSDLYPLPPDVVRPAAMYRPEIPGVPDRLGSWTAPGNDFGRWIVALFCWMETILDSTEAHPPRALQRRAARLVDAKGPQTVTVTHYRRPAHQEQSDASQATSSGRVYSHRWPVIGHWRQVACGPGRTERRPRRIAPYIAGPADKPFVPKARIWAADRGGAPTEEAC